MKRDNSLAEDLAVRETAMGHCANGCGDPHPMRHTLDAGGWRCSWCRCYNSSFRKMTLEDITRNEKRVAIIGHIAETRGISWDHALMIVIQNEMTQR